MFAPLSSPCPSSSFPHSFTFLPLSFSLPPSLARPPTFDLQRLQYRPDTEDELDDLFRVTDKDGSGQIDFDEFVNMMVVRVGFKATPGIMLKVVQLDDFKPNGSEKKKGKKKKTKAPTIETNIVGYSTEKAKPKKDNKDPYMRYKDKERG